MPHLRYRARVRDEKLALGEKEAGRALLREILGFRVWGLDSFVFAYRLAELAYSFAGSIQTRTAENCASGCGFEPYICRAWGC